MRQASYIMKQTGFQAITFHEITLSPKPCQRMLDKTNICKIETVVFGVCNENIVYKNNIQCFNGKYGKLWKGIELYTNINLKTFYYRICEYSGFSGCYTGGISLQFLLLVKQLEKTCDIRLLTVIITCKINLAEKGGLTTRQTSSSERLSEKC